MLPQGLEDGGGGAARDVGGSGEHRDSGESAVAFSVSKYIPYPAFSTVLSSMLYAPDARGINSLQLVRIGSEWKVQSLVWQKEDAAHPIPPQFAPR